MSRRVLERSVNPVVMYSYNAAGEVGGGLIGASK